MERLLVDRKPRKRSVFLMDVTSTPDFVPAQVLIWRHFERMRTEGM